MYGKQETYSGRALAATRDALITAARRLWGERGYADVGTEIATAAGVTRARCITNSPTRQRFSSPWWRFVEQDVMTRLATEVASSGATTPADAIGPRSMPGSGCR